MTGTTTHTTAFLHEGSASEVDVRIQPANHGTGTITAVEFGSLAVIQTSDLTPGEFADLFESVAITVRAMAAEYERSQTEQGSGS